jgi:hypothetical protein
MVSVLSRYERLETVWATAEALLFTPFIKLSVKGVVPNARLVPVNRTGGR